MAHKSPTGKPKKKSYPCTFSLSEKEKTRYHRLCTHENIGFRQLVKKALREYYKQADLPETDPEIENQLDLFEPFDLFGQPVKKRK